MECANPHCRPRGAPRWPSDRHKAGPITGKDRAGKEVVVPNPAYDEWYVKDQQALSFVIGSLGRDVLSQVATHETAAKLWAAIEAMYASQNHADVYPAMYASQHTALPRHSEQGQPIYLRVCRQDVYPAR
jgi:hypothetical protein